MRQPTTGRGGQMDYIAGPEVFSPGLRATRVSRHREMWGLVSNRRFTERQKQEQVSS